MGRPRKFNADSLKAAIKSYFKSISRTKQLTELVPGEDVDKYGHPVLVPRVILTDSGKPMTVTEFVRPPTAGGLCQALGIHRSTWAEWCDPVKFPEFREVTEWARDVFQSYLETELLIRAGKDTRGVEFALSANYGQSAKKTVDLGPAAVQAVAAAAPVPPARKLELLREMMSEFGGQIPGLEGVPDGSSG